MAYNPNNPNGQATMANSAPVVIASDQSAITVTATNLDVQSGGADLATTTQAGAIQTAVELIDDTVAVLGTATYTEATSKGLIMGAVRRDADTTLVNTTNEIAPLIVDANGYLKVEVFSGQTLPVSFTGSGDVATQTTLASLLTSSQLIDDTIFTAGTDTYTEATSKGQLMLGVRRDADTTLANTTNEMVPFQVDANGYLKVEVFSGQTLPISVASGGIASGAIASGAIASGAVASGAFASGSIASGAIASGAIAAGAITAGATSIATTEDTASAGGDHLVKIAVVRLDTPIANAAVSNDGDYTSPVVDNFRKLWVTGSVPEDTAHVAGEGLTINGVRRIDTAATSAGTSGDWATMDASAEGAIWATLTPTTTSGLTTFMASGSDGSSILVATAQAIKASTGNMYGYYAYNPEAAVTFVHFYNTAAASVTVGTTNPLFTIAIPAGAAANLMFPYPVNFSNAGWSCAATTTAGGNTAPATGVSLVVWYK